MSDQNKIFKAIIRWSKFIFTLLALGFIAYQAWLSRAELHKLYLEVDVSWLISSILLLAILHLVSPLFTQIFFRSIDLELAYKKLAIIHIINLPTKYIPGGIWHSVARVNGYFKMGVSSRDISIYFLAESAVVAGVTLGVGGIAAYFVFASSEWSNLFLYFGCAALAVAIAFPLVIHLFLSVNFKKPKLREYLFSFSVSILYWTGAACAFVLFFLAFPKASSDMSALSIGLAYVFSWGMGYVAIFAPQGIGVTEFVTAKLLATNGEFTVLIVTFAGFRLVMLITDVFAWGCLTSVQFLKKKHIVNP